MCSVESITKADVEKVVNAQFAAGRSVRTVSYALGLLRQILERCAEEGLVSRNVARSVHAKGAPAAMPEAFTADELAKIATHIDGMQLEHAFTLTLLGLRRSEVLGLRWSDIDLKAGTLTVERSRVEKTDVVGAPKTQRGHRTLPLDKTLVALLGRVGKDQGAIGGYVVVDAFGRPMRPERYSDEWRAMLAAADVRYLDLRAARRSAVTAMRDAGVADHITARWTGHDESVMRKHCSVAHDERMAEASAALASVLRPAL